MTLRWLTVAGVVTVACGLFAPAATACEIDSFGVSGGSGGSVRPGDPVSFSMRIVSTDDSPGDSRFEVDAGGVVVASGLATPSTNGGEWTNAGTFPMPDLGSGKQPVTVQLRLIDSGTNQPAPTPLQYDGTPVSAQPPASPAPADDGTAPPTAAKAPASATPEPASESVPKPRNRGARPDAGRPREAKPSSPARQVAEARPDRATAAVPAPVPRAIAQASTTPRHAARAFAPIAPKPRSGSHTRPGAPQALRLAAEDGSGIGPASMPVADQPRTAPAGWRCRRAPSALGLALVLALVVGGGGLTIVLRRRRAPRPRDPDAPRQEVEIDARDLAIEAELQELLAEARLESELAERREARS